MSYNDEARVSPFRSRGFIFGAIVIGLIAAAAIIAIVVNLLTPATPAERPETTSSSSPTSTDSPSAEGSVCGLDDVELDGTVKAAPDTEWSFVGRVAVPSSGDAGPGVIEPDGFRYCYSRTPEGALFAAANLFGLTIDRSTLDQVAQHLVVAGPARDSFIESAPSTMAQPAEAFSANVAGFRVLQYDGREATVDLAVRLTTGELLSYVFDVSWADGDWKWSPAEGGAGVDVVVIQSLGGYTPWSEAA